MKNSDEGSLVLGTKNFQQKTNRWKMSYLVKKFINENLVDKKKLDLKKNLIKKRSCPSCKSKLNFILFTKDYFKYRRCENCSLVYVSPILKEKKIINLYKNSQYSNAWGKILSNKTEYKFNQNKFENILRDIKKITNKKGKLLDVGCAVGQFLDTFKKENWKTYGIELNDFERKISQKKKHVVYNKKIEDDFLPKEHFDLVSILEVLEHVYDPLKVIKSISRITKKNGLLIIIVPNVESLAASIMQSRCNMFLGMSHITMFSPHTLKLLVEKFSFKQIFCTSITSELNVINNYLNLQDPYLGESQKKHYLLRGWNERKILKNLKGYKIKAIFKKI
jgi:2-polyprenyl-3-methyl-5-hydroxy-6-metoxy-1,4-benzoquinol methylase